MARPQRMRKIARCPKYNLDTELKPIEITIDEYEAIRFKDYHNIKQTEAASFMGISQSTFHRILNSARHKMATSLIEGRRIVLIKGNTIINSNKYLCDECGFEWSNPEKDYKKCPDCGSKNIKKIELEKTEKNFSNLCKCSNCDYTEPKIRGIPCKRKTCPKCGSPLHGKGKCRK